MSKLFDWLSQKGPAGWGFYPTSGDATHAAMSGVGIAVFFLTLGLIFVLMAGVGPKANSTRMKRNFSRLIGLAFIVCAMSRGIEVLALWHNFPHLILLFRDFTCIAGAVASSMLIPVIKQSVEQRTLEEVHAKMQETVDKLEEVKQLSNDINSLK